MASGDPFVTQDDFNDWLQTPLLDTSFDDSLSSIFAQDPLAALHSTNDKYNAQAGRATGPLGGLYGAGQGGSGADGSTFAQGDVGLPEGQSPSQGGAYSYASSSVGDTSFSSLTSGPTAPSVSSSSELDSLFSSAAFSAQPSFAAPTPSFNYGTVEQLAANLPATFDTSALQSLFADPLPPPHAAATSSSSSVAGLSPFSAASFPPQTLSPAPTATTTSASPFSPAMNAFSPQNHGIFLATPSASSGSSVASPPQQPLQHQQQQQGLAVPRPSFDFGAPPPSAQPATAAPPHGMTFGTFQASQTTGPRSRTSLAATAGVTLPPSLLMQPSSHPANMGNHSTPLSYTLRADPSAPLPLAMLQGHAAEHVQPQALAAGQGQGPGQGRTRRAAAVQQQQQRTQERSSVEVLANAGIQGGQVYQTPLLQLNPNLTFPPFAGDLPPIVEQPASTSTAEKEEKEEAPPSGPVKGGRAAKGKAAAAAAAAAEAKKKEKDKGHNAVEQKYRNSINNALATLRDEIPALQHLKPLPSMPPSRRKASQFTLAPAAVTHLVTPAGLVDGIPAAKTLSKGTILQKAIEYIVYLRSARDGLEEDLAMMKELVEGSVAGGEVLTKEWERRRAINEARREGERAEREREAAAEEGDGGEDDGEDDEDEPAPVAKGKKAAASKKRGAPSLSSTASAAPAGKKARLPSQHISPALTSNYSRVQALNAAHLEALAASQQQQPYHHQQQDQHTFPPSPASSGEDGVSPHAVMGGGANGSPPRVLLASFMGLSFAGGTAYDWASSAAAAEEAVVGGVAKAWAGRLVRRSASADAAASGAGLVDLLHPSLLSGLVALGLASIVVSLVWLVYPLFSSSARRAPSSPSSAPHSTRASRRRAEALAALATLNTSSTSTKADGAEPETYGAACDKALQARKELVKLVGAPGAVGLLVGLVKEGLVSAMREVVGLGVYKGKKGAEEQRKREEAVAWVRVAEIEASLGDRIPYLSRCYTFLRLSNLSHSSSWPSTAPSSSTSPSAVDALLAVHLLSLGHAHWAGTLWNRMLASSKKSESTASSNGSSSFVEVAVSSDFATVQALLDPSSRPVKEDDAPAFPSDTVPLLVLAEATCEDALRDVWQKLFVGVAASTTSTDQITASPLEVDELNETIESVLLATVEGSEVHDLAAMSKVFVACYLAGTSKDGVDSSATAASMREVFLRLALGYRQSSTFSRLACARPFLQLFLPVFSPSSFASTLFPTHEATLTSQPASEVDLLVTTTLEWLLVRKAGAAALFEQAQYADEDVKVDAALHARALAVRRLLGHDLFQVPSSLAEESHGEVLAEKVAGVAMEDAKDALVDALTGVARRAAGLKGGLWDEEDSGVELEL